jgi:hypothetical protein
MCDLYLKQTLHVLINGITLCDQHVAQILKCSRYRPISHDLTHLKLPDSITSADALTISVWVGPSPAMVSSCGSSSCTILGPCLLATRVSSSAALLRTAHPSLSLHTAATLEWCPSENWSGQARLDNRAETDDPGAGPYSQLPRLNAAAHIIVMVIATYEQKKSL